MDRQRVRIDQHGGLGLIWCAGWLFAIGFLQLTFWKGLLAVVVWPYFLGVHFAGRAGPSKQMCVTQSLCIPMCKYVLT